MIKSLPPPYPFLFAFAPIVGLFADNYREVPPLDLLRPVVASSAFVLMAYLFSYGISRDTRKSALLAAVVVVVVFAYGAVRSVVPDEALRTRYYLLSWLALGTGGYASCAVVLRHARTTLTHLTLALNWIGFAVVAGPLVMAAVLAMSSPRVDPVVGRVAHGERGSEFESVAEVAALPDIYYVVLDAHGREDVLKERYGLDAVALVDALRQKGFYIADRAVSNYTWTNLSLAATLNLTYLDDFVARVGAVPNSRDGFSAASAHLYDYIQDSTLRRFLEGRGYRVMGNSSNYNVTRAFHTREFPLPFALSEFERTLLENMAVEPILARFHKSPHDGKRRSILLALEQLPRVAAMASPKFVFVHIAAPHSPFMFDADGGTVPRHQVYDGTMWHQEQRLLPGWAKWYREGYASQVQGLGHHVETAIDGILANSARSPIIIVQGDHGPRLGLTDGVETSDIEERFGILSAFYLPGDAKNKLYPSMSSLNTFRLVLSEYFGADYPLLEDRSYFSMLNLDFEDVTDLVR